MSRISNTVKVDKDFTTILVTKNDDLELVMKITVRVDGHTWSNGSAIAHTIMNHKSNITTVLDRNQSNDHRKP